VHEHCLRLAKVVEGTLELWQADKEVLAILKSKGSGHSKVEA